MNIPALASESTYIEQRKYFHQATKVLSSQSSKIMDYMLSRFPYNEVAVLQLNNLLFAFCFALQTVFAVVLRTCHIAQYMGATRPQTPRCFQV